MRVSIEWFLLDNWAMDAAVLILAGALASLRPRWFLGSAVCFLCAIYALIAVWRFPIMLTLPFRLAVGAILAFGLRFKGITGYVRAVLCVYLCAFLLGGLMIALSPSGTYDGGLIVGTLKTRIVLLSAPALALTPRLLRRLRSRALFEGNIICVRVTYSGQQLELSALIDTGNLLFEPISGIPVMLIQDWPYSEEGLPIPYSGVIGSGELKAQRVNLCEVSIDGEWQAVDIMVARAPSPILHAQAIMPASAVPMALLK